jgi:hypothetical protein
MHIPLQTHLHTYRLWWRHLLHRYVWVSNGCGGGEVDWSGVTALPPRTVGKYSRCSESTALPLSCPSNAARAIDKWGIQETRPIHLAILPLPELTFPSHVTGSRVISLWLVAVVVLVSFSTWLAPDPLQYHWFYCAKNTLYRVPRQCED